MTEPPHQEWPPKARYFDPDYGWYSEETRVFLIAKYNKPDPEPLLECCARVLRQVGRRLSLWGMLSWPWE